KDLQDIKTTLAVNYRVENKSATNLYKTVGNSYEQTILTPAIEESIKSIISKYTAEQTITLRPEVSSECMKELQEKVEKYGIVIDNFNIINLEFSEEYSKAIEEKQVAEQKLATAKLESEAKIVEAEATQKSNELLKQTLTDELIMKEFIDKWDGKLPETYAGDNIMGLFNLK
ncbi:MAG: prohibitin family protein, partial [Bacilli bacterium]|nr:prohibitin family protein [Bacilli bacterium]